MRTTTTLALVCLSLVSAAANLVNGLVDRLCKDPVRETTVVRFGHTLDAAPRWVAALLQ